MVGGQLVEPLAALTFMIEPYCGYADPPHCLLSPIGQRKALRMYARFVQSTRSDCLLTYLLTSWLTSVHPALVLEGVTREYAAAQPSVGF
jgi:hypothetical protein